MHLDCSRHSKLPISGAKLHFSLHFKQTLFLMCFHYYLKVLIFNRWCSLFRFITEGRHRTTWVWLTAYIYIYINLQSPIFKLLFFWSLEGSRNKLWAQHWHIINFCGKHWAVAYSQIQVATEERDRSFRDLHLGSWWLFTFSSIWFWVLDVQEKTKWGELSCHGKPC